MNDIEEQMDVIILTAFPQYKQEDLENITRARFFELYARAEWSFGIRGVQLDMQLENGQNSLVPSSGHTPQLPPLSPAQRAQAYR
jgi:hypothetical protein